jgi:hypothetical protein
MRLSMRTILTLVAVLAVPFAFWVSRLRAGVPFPAGLDVAAVAVTIVSGGLIAGILIGAFRDRSRLIGPLEWALLALNVTVAIWFTSVESTLFVENCPVCGHGRDVIESRFFSVTPRRVTREFPSLTELIASDLGIPCDHEPMTGWWKHRLFGGCLWGECIIGIHRISDLPQYPPCARDAVRSWAANDPEFIRNFRERVLEGRDREYLRTLYLRMPNECPPDRLTGNPDPEHQTAAGPDFSLSDVGDR